MAYIDMPTHDIIAMPQRRSECLLLERWSRVLPGTVARAAIYYDWLCARSTTAIAQFSDYRGAQASPLLENKRV